MKPRRVVITGIGVVAPNGIGKDAFWDALVNGRSGVKRISSFDPSGLPTQIAGEVRDFDPRRFIPGDKWKTMSRQTQLALAAVTLALEDANLEKTTLPLRGSCLLGTSNPGYDLIEMEFLKFTGPRGLSSGVPWALKAIDPFSSCGAASLLTGLCQSSLTFCTSCTAGLNSIGNAFWKIRRGELDIALAGSVDAAIFPITFLFFCAAGIMSRRNDAPESASRPFDRERDGGVLSEGAAMVVLEELDAAIARGAHIYAEVLGYGETTKSVDPASLKDAFVHSMQMAFRDAGVPPGETDYVCAHAPSDPVTDAIETAALKEVLGRKAYACAVSSIKSMIGNPQSAAGAMQVAAAAMSVHTGIIPPTINLETPDPQCDLDYVPWHYRRADVKVALINSHGINGTDASLIIIGPGAW